MLFNVLTGNTDDHARNHAAFWDGHNLTLTPAYDICPQSRSTGIATQAMLILGERNDSRLSLCRQAAYKFNLGDDKAQDVIDQLRQSILDNWAGVCGEAQLSEPEKKFFWRRQFLNPSIDE